MLLLLQAVLLPSFVLSDYLSAKIEDSPWVVSIYKFNPGSPKELLGAGTIVSHRLVLTAYRTIGDDTSNAKNIWVRAGSENLLNDTGAQWHETQELRFHPEFHRGSTWDWRHDVALIITDTGFTYGPTVQIIQTSSTLSAPMIEAELQGFGINYPGWDNGRPELLSKTLKIADNSTCREQSSKIYALPVNLEASQMCVLDTDRNVDNCVQNVGGPVTVCDVLVGVVSWHPGTCYNVDAGILFTDVSAYNSWIYDATVSISGHGAF